MSRHTPQAIAPAYLKQFECLGGACPQTCCAGWVVNVDKRTWKKYREIRIQPLRDNLRKCIQTTPSADTSRYGTILLKPDKHCYFQEPDGLCSIQNTLGHNALPDTCQQYPRSFYQVGDDWHAFASISCPEVARLVISQPDALKTETIELNQFSNSAQITQSVRLKSNILGQEARNVAAIALRQRMLWLCDHDQLDGIQALKTWIILARKIISQHHAAEQWKNNNPHLPSEDHLNYLLSNFADALDQFSDQGVDACLSLFTELPRFDEVERLDILLNCIHSIVDFCENNVHGELQKILVLTLQQSPQKLKEIGYPTVINLEKSYPWALKNILKNSLWERFFYISVFKPGKLENALLTLSIRTALMRLLLSAIACQKNIDLNDLQRVAYAIGRPFDHNNQFVEKMLQTFETRGARSLATAIALLG